MGILPTEATNALPYPAAAANLSATPSEIGCEVMNLFEQFRSPLLRYVLSFGMSVHDAEEVTQEVFRWLFRHLQLRKTRRNLRGWIFCVAQNLALKHHYASRRRRDMTASIGTIVEKQ